MNPQVTVLGAGPSGALMSIFLARNGHKVMLYERRPDLRRVAIDAGRSINLALAERGIHALRQAGVFADVEPLLIPMRGRVLHAVDGSQSFARYGQREHEVIYSVSRPGLTQVLLDHAQDRHGISTRFLQSARRLDLRRGELTMRDEADGVDYTLRVAPLIAADGGGSTVRQSMTEQLGVRCREELLEHGYKELTLPPAADGSHRIEKHALHIWPRGGFMLIALPNLDGSFTMTLFLAHAGPESFASLRGREDLEAFFGRHFPDVVPMMPGLAEEFFEHAVGRMGTVYCDRWSAPDGRAVLLGDAAHAIVPFHGQGMNACFEDCVELNRLLEATGDWSRSFAQFEQLRRPNTDAIATMALENYVEMRDTVRDPKFMLRKELSFELERRYPDHFIPRYSMVMFHYEIPYAVAYQRGQVQAQILEELTAHVDSVDAVDAGAARRLVQSRLAPLQTGATPAV